MKRLSILVLVLAMASAAHAGFVILDGEGNSSIDLMSLPGLTGSLTLYVQYTGTDCMMMDVEVDADWGATISDGVLLGNADTNYDAIVTPGHAGRQMEFLQGWDDGTTFPANTNLVSFDIDLSGVTFGVTISVTGVDYMSVDTGFNLLYATVVPYTIAFPEPVTVVLLGLGGLILCRRKPRCK